MSTTQPRNSQYFGAFVLIPAHAFTHSDASRSRAAVMYCFCAFILARMWMVAIAEQNVQLIVFSSVGVVLCLLVCWLRRRRNRLERELGIIIDSDQAIAPIAFNYHLPPARAGVSTATIERLTRIQHNEEFKSADVHNFSSTSISIAPDIENQAAELEGHYGTECSICLSEFEQAQELIVLDCRHAFHSNCVLAWLQYNVTCPMCKQDVRTPAEREQDG